MTDCKLNFKTKSADIVNVSVKLVYRKKNNTNFVIFLKECSCKKCFGDCNATAKFYVFRF
jgi:hypothetical protein